MILPDMIWSNGWCVNCEHRMQSWTKIRDNKTATLGLSLSFTDSQLIHPVGLHKQTSSQRE